MGTRQFFENPHGCRGESDRSGAYRLQSWGREAKALNELGRVVREMALRFLSLGKQATRFLEGIRAAHSAGWKDYEMKLAALR
jgi:hypothetical protein